jgi:hypothetical protein
MQKLFTMITIIKNSQVQEAVKKVVQNFTLLVVDSAKLARAVVLALFRRAA